LTYKRSGHRLDRIQADAAPQAAGISPRRDANLGNPAPQLARGTWQEAVTSLLTSPTLPSTTVRAGCFLSWFCLCANITIIRQRRHDLRFPERHCQRTYEGCPFPIEQEYKRAFFDKLKAAAEAVGDKTNEMIEITKLNSKIAAETNAVSEAKKRIGGIIFDYYQKGESFPPEIGELCESIQKSQDAIEALQNEISAIKSEGAKPAAAAQSRGFSQAGGTPVLPAGHRTPPRPFLQRMRQQAGGRRTRKGSAPAAAPKSTRASASAANAAAKWSNSSRGFEKSGVVTDFPYRSSFHFQNPFTHKNLLLLCSFLW
jgi:hypothetical protein